MLKDYTAQVGSRYDIPWEGFVFSTVKIGHALVIGSHDQDFIHNGNKLINSLDSLVRVLQLGGDICCLEYVSQIYNKFTYDQHGL
jgi:hypothetical protein